MALVATGEAVVVSRVGELELRVDYVGLRDSCALEVGMPVGFDGRVWDFLVLTLLRSVPSGPGNISIAAVRHR
jgi:hypothetical protein